MAEDQVTQKHPNEIAPALLKLAAEFAEAAFAAYREMYPEQAAVLARMDPNYDVRISDLLSTKPRCVVVRVLERSDASEAGIVCNAEQEVAHVDLQLSAPAVRPSVH